MMEEFLLQNRFESSSAHMCFIRVERHQSSYINKQVAKHSLKLPAFFVSEDVLYDNKVYIARYLDVLYATIPNLRI